MTQSILCKPKKFTAYKVTIESFLYGKEMKINPELAIVLSPFYPKICLYFPGKCWVDKNTCRAVPAFYTKICILI